MSKYKPAPPLAIVKLLLPSPTLCFHWTSSTREMKAFLLSNCLHLLRQALGFLGVIRALQLSPTFLQPQLFTAVSCSIWVATEKNPAMSLRECKTQYTSMRIYSNYHFILFLQNKALYSLHPPTLQENFQFSIIQFI